MPVAAKAPRSRSFVVVEPPPAMNTVGSRLRRGLKAAEIVALPVRDFLRKGKHRAVGPRGEQKVFFRCAPSCCFSA
jgi:hypothetical protein